MDEKQSALPLAPTTPAPAAPSPTPDLSQTVATLAAQKAEVERKLADFTKAQEAAAKKHADDLAAQGDWRAKAELHASKLSEVEKQLQEQAEHAALGRMWAERENKRVTDVAARMDDNWKRTLDAIPTLQGKADYVALFEQTQATAVAAGSSPSLPRATPPPGGAPAPASTSANLIAMLNRREISLDEAQQRFPREYAEQVGSGGTSFSKTKRKTLWSS
jgi:hypothetical protein